MGKLKCRVARATTGARRYFHAVDILCFPFEMVINYAIVYYFMRKYFIVCDFNCVQQRFRLQCSCLA